MNKNNELINVSNLLNVRNYKSKLTDSLKPQGKLEVKESSWEEKIITNLNIMKKSEKGVTV